MTKFVYTKADEAQMVTMYDAANTQDERIEAVKLIADNLGASVNSVRAKLAFLGHYKANKRTTKTGGPIVKKSELVDQINEVCELGLNEAEATSLEKATKNTLNKILALGERLVGFVDE